MTGSSLVTPIVRPSSLPALVGQSYASLIIALVLGNLLALPVLVSRLQMFGETTYQLRQAPPDDAALVQWGNAQPKVTAFRVRREGSDLWVRHEFRGMTPRPAPGDVASTMRQLGYGIGGMRGGPSGIVGSLPALLTDPLVLAALLCSTQLALGGIAIFNRARARRKGRALPALFPSHQHRRAIVWGVAGGVGLIALGHLYSEILVQILGKPAPSLWDAVGCMPVSTRLVFVLFGVFGAPVTEELFFRGYLSAMFREGGWSRLGIVFSAVLFAALHLSDPYHVPCIWVIGVVLAWLYHRSGSLLTAIIAHLVNNGTAMALMFLGWGS